VIARLALGVLLGLGLAAAPALSASAQAPKRAVDQKASESPPGKEKAWTEKDYKAVRDRDEARQELWDRKMKELTRSICTGC
jgi:hypothetical protein